MCGREARCVSFAYCNKQPAAAKPRGDFSTPNARKSFVPNWRLSSEIAVLSSNSQIGRRRRPL